MDDLFPRIQKSIETLIEDEEGNIPGKKLLMLGTMVIILGSLFPMDVLADHRSHRSHSSHSSHSSGSHRSGGHESHVSHVSHQSHTSSGTHSNHASHTSHSNTGSHSNSRYSAEGDVSYAPAASTINGISVPPVATTENLFQLPEVNQNIETPNVTSESGILPNLAVPSSTLGVKFDVGQVHAPSSTDKIE